MNCKNCGKVLNQGEMFCGACGTKVDNIQNNTMYQNNNMYSNSNVNPNNTMYQNNTGYPNNNMYMNNNMYSNNMQYQGNMQMNGVIYATFGDRFVAFLRDAVHIWWFVIINFALFTFIGLFLELTGNDDSSLSTFVHFAQIAGSILFVFYGEPLYALFADASKKHTTVGKLKRNMCVLNKNGNYLTFGESFLRMLLKYLTLIIPFGIIISIIVMCSTEKKQFLHDVILGHYVIKRF